MSKSTVELVPCQDVQRRTCLEVDRFDGVVQFIPLDVLEGLQVRELPSKAFDQTYQPIAGYPPERAAKLYAGYAQAIGATTAAMDHLRRATAISPEEYDMATAKKTPAATKAAAKPAAKKVAAKPAAKKPEPAKKAVKPTAAKESKARGETAAALFQELIMEGKLTDDQIFAKVQTKFGLDDKKRGYVSWYRNYLTKHGKNPPAAVGA